MADQTYDKTQQVIDAFKSEGVVPYTKPQLVYNHWNRFGYRQNGGYRLLLGLGLRSECTDEELVDILKRGSQVLDLMRPHEWVKSFLILRNKDNSGVWYLQLKLVVAEPDIANGSEVVRERELTFTIPRSDIKISKIRNTARFITDFFLKRPFFSDFDGKWNTDTGEKAVEKRAVIHTLARGLMNEKFQIRIDQDAIRLTYETDTNLEESETRTARFSPCDEERDSREYVRENATLH